MEPVDGEVDRAAQADEVPPRRPGVLSRLLGSIKGIAGLIAAIGVIGGAIGWGLTQLHNAHNGSPAGESALLEKLHAGNTFASFRRKLGQEPDARRPIDSARDAGPLRREGASRYVFVRKYDYLQAVVAQDDTVLGFSIVARTPDLHPAFSWFGQSIVLGRTRLSAISANRIGGFCGASRAQFFEVAGGSNADNAQELGIGITNIGARPEQLNGQFCKGWERLGDCRVDELGYLNAIPTSRATDCYFGSPEGKRARGMTMNTYVESAPVVRISSDMLAPAEPEVGPARGS